MKRNDYILLGSIISIVAILVLSGRIAIPCIFYKITGLYCPVCGSTRAIKALLKGDILLSIRNNLLLYTIMPLLLGLWFINKKTKNKYKEIIYMLMIFLIIIAIIYGVLRNLPYFYFLAPIGN